MYLTLVLASGNLSSANRAEGIEISIDQRPVPYKDRVIRDGCCSAI